MKGNCVTVKLESGIPCGIENLQEKQNWAAKSLTLGQNAGKVKSDVVFRAPTCAEENQDVALNIV